MSQERHFTSPVETLTPIKATREFAVVALKDGCEVLWQGTPTEGALLGTFSLTREVLCDQLDRVLRELLVQYCEKHDIDSRIKQMLDRRIELAIKDFEDKVLRELGAAMRDAAIKRVRSHIEKMPLQVSITTTPTPAEEAPNGHTAQP